MIRLDLRSVTNENSEVFHELMQEYARELDRNQDRTTDPVILERWTNSIIQKQGDRTCCLKLCYYGAQAVGFLYGKIDRPDDRGYKRVGQGYIMEFYVVPKYRRQGCGISMLKHLEQFFAEQGVTQMYLTADPVTGKPFWAAQGFVSKGEFSPENGQEFFEKAVCQTLIDGV